MTYNALPPLKGVWGKLRRAKVHRDALDVYITETFADEANRPLVGAKLEPESGDYIHYISRMPDLEPFLLEVGLRFGDAIHNLRSALNHLVMQLALLPKRKRTITPGQTLSIEFPINVSCGSFDKDWKRCCRHVDPLSGQRSRSSSLMTLGQARDSPTPMWGPGFTLSDSCEIFPTKINTASSSLRY